MTLNLTNGDAFTTGALSFSCVPIPDREDVTPRIIFEVEIEGETEQAVLDTGAPYLVCSPDIAQRIQFDPANALDAEVILIHGTRVTGRIHRARIVIVPEEGTGVDFEATAFVPDPDQGLPPELLPLSFLGFFGCLERIRLGLDPLTEMFYFGAV
jgi:hypothetical protein